MPELRVIATSRQPLGADGEQQLALGPLRDDDAVALFVDRARAVQPSFDAADEGVSGLCRRLDGLPLAIELAAARCKSLPVPEIELRLANRFELLVGGPRAGPSRQHGLRDAIDWSYDLLFEHERSAFCRLAVCRGGFTISAIEALCGPAGLETVQRLVDKSLVVAETGGSAARFTMLESLREYGLDRLDAAGESMDARHAHVRWCAALADDVAAGIRGPDQLSWLDLLDAEHDNLVAALTHCATDGSAGGRRPDGRPRAAVVVPRSRSRSPLVGRAVRRRRGAPDVRAAMLTWSGLLADFGGGDRGPADLEAELLLAERRQREAIAIGAELDDEQIVTRARAQCSLTLTRQRFAGIPVDQDDIDEMIDLALAGFARRRRRLRWRPDVHRPRGRSARGRAARGLRRGDRSRPTGCRPLRRPVRAGPLEWVEGLLADAMGDVDDAYRHVERGLRLLDELGMRQEVTIQAEALVRLAERRDEPELAAQWRTFVAGRAGGLARHDILLRAAARHGEALHATAAGERERAVAAHRDALTGYVEADAPLAIAFTESCLGFLAAAMGDPSASRRPPRPGVARRRRHR